ncbi:MAG: galactosyldiacylglycerol synthase [Candidatus Latescibacterota bacterium]|nr:MAG: galactosyldiacylglycerol synthase [Candidatus Latescibacterota bacterium]
MIKIYDNENGKFLGQIDEEELQFLIDELEEESLEDQDYYLNRDTIEMLAKKGGDMQLIKLLTGALGNRDGVEIRWSRS